MNNEQKIIWFAGFYEGEGYTSNDKGNRNRLKVGMDQNDRTPLDIGKEIWGGCIRQRTRKSPASDKICISHSWILNHKQGIKFLSDIKPYMLIPYKIKQMENCISKSKEKWEGVYKCHFCDNIFSDYSGRRRHELNQHINKGQLFQCDLCERTYKSRDSLKRHKRINHKPDASISNKLEMRHTLKCSGNPLGIQS